jgi:hypothetical protein
MRRALNGVLCLMAIALTACAAFSADRPADPPKVLKGLPLVFVDEFEDGADHWLPTDPKAWEIADEDGNHVYALARASKYKPPVRSPENISLVKDLELTDFILEARMKQTGKEYGHRDLCVFYGYQDPTHFYYTHIATKADPHANSIFLVNNEPRVSIAKERTDGTDWGTDVYHTVRVERDTAAGTIKVYFDDMEKPIMVAEDRNFLWGKVGFGSFDDTGKIDAVRIWGKKKAE